MKMSKQRIPPQPRAPPQPPPITEGGDAKKGVAEVVAAATAVATIVSSSTTGNPKPPAQPPTQGSLTTTVGSESKTIAEAVTSSVVSAATAAASIASNAAEAVAQVTTPDDESYIDNPPEEVVEMKEQEYVRAYRCEAWSGRAAFATGIGMLIAALATLGESDWMSTAGPRVIAGLGMGTFASYYVKHVASRRIRDLGKWLRRHHRDDAV